MIPLWKALFGRARSEREMAEEIAAHIENRAANLERSGMNAQAALRRSRLEFGAVGKYSEDCRQARGYRPIDEAAQDLRYAVRTMRRNRGVTAVAILSLAVGIGANTAVYSLLNALLLRTLPVPHPERLVVMREFSDEGPGASSYPLFSLIRSSLAGKVLDDVAATAIPGTGHAALGGAEPIRIVTEDVTANYFSVLDVHLIAGENFKPAQDKIGADPVAIISERIWRARFASARDMIGKVLMVDDRPMRVIGIAPAQFHGMQVESAVDLWKNLTSGDAELLRQRGMNFLALFGRLKNDVPIARADAAVRAVYDADQRDQIQQMPARKRRSPRHMGVWPGDTGFSMLRQTFALPLRIVMWVVAMVLLIACANIANLLLARMSARRREVATRISMGAGAARLVRQFLTESALLATAGAVLGIGLAWWCDRSLVGLLPNGGTPLALDAGLDWHVLSFSAAISIGSVLLFGLAPALRVRHLDVAAGMKLSTAEFGHHTFLRPGKLLVAGQVALSLVLVFGAGLFLRTLMNLRNVDAGFRTDRVMTFGASMPRQYSREQQRAVADRLIDGLRVEPGVEAASMAWPGVFSQGRWDGSFQILGRPAGTYERISNLMIAGTGLFDVLKAPLLAGRDFDDRDNEAAPNVVVINQTLASTYFRGESPIGQKIYGQGTVTEARPATIIGVVKDIRHWGLRDKAKPAIYFPAAQMPPRWSPAFVLRSRVGVAQTMSLIRQAAHAADRQTHVEPVQTLDELVDNYLERERLLASISGIFGIVALLLAAVGIYGVIAYSVARRTNEIGLRMALGAGRKQVLGMIIRETAVIPLLGLATGMPAALALSRVATSLVFGLDVDAAGPLACAAAVMMTLALIAATAPARRAMRIDPINVLRHE